MSVLAGACSQTTAGVGGGPGALHVSPLGNDLNPGTRQAPFATLERARDAIRILKQMNSFLPEGVVVWLEEGLYARRNTFELTAEDIGAPRFPITYRARKRGEVRLSAGRLLHVSQFQLVEDPLILDRAAPIARGRLRQIDLGALDVGNVELLPNRFTDGGGLFALYFDNRPMPLSRWPNQGYAAMRGVLDNGLWHDDPAKRRGGRFLYDGDRPARWPIGSGLWLEGFWRVPWRLEALRVAAIDNERHEIALAVATPGGIGSPNSETVNGVRPGDGTEKWRVINLIEEIDTPGEWSVDFRTKMLYFWPPENSGERDGWLYNQVTIADLNLPMIRVEGVSYTTFEGLIVEGGLGDGVVIKNSAGVRVAGCEIRNLGGNGVVIDGGAQNGVVGCDLYGLGHAGVVLGGGDRKSLKPAGHYALNNHIHDVGLRKRVWAPGIQLGASEMTGDSGEARQAVGMRVVHNLIHDVPHAAILFGGNDNTIELNEIHHASLEADDMGAIYSRGDWASRGNVIQHNFIHQSPRADAIHLGGGAGGSTVFGNVLFATRCGILIGGGGDNMVRNNIVVAALEAGIHFDNRGVALGYANDKKLRQTLGDVAFRRSPWSEKYPKLKTILDRDGRPTGNIIERNLTVECRQAFDMQLPKGDLWANRIANNFDLPEPGADPGFANRKRLDFRLGSGSSVYKNISRFKPIPFDEIGLYKGDFRKRVPERALEENRVAF